MERIASHFQGKKLPQRAYSLFVAAPIGVEYCLPAEPGRSFLPSAPLPSLVGLIRTGVVQLNSLPWDCIDTGPSYFHKGYLLQAFDWFDSSNPPQYC